MFETLVSGKDKVTVSLIYDDFALTVYCNTHPQNKALFLITRYVCNYCYIIAE